LRKQAKNEQANFAFKEKNNQVGNEINKIFNPIGSTKFNLNGSFHTNLGPSGTPLRGFGVGNMSFDDPEDEFMVLH